MVLAFTNEQKKKIESSGFMVVEFKRILHNIIKVIKNACGILKEIASKVEEYDFKGE